MIDALELVTLLSGKGRMADKDFFRDEELFTMPTMRLDNKSTFPEINMRTFVKEKL